MHWLSAVAATFSAAGLIIGVRAATIPVRDSMDDFIGDLRRQGRWALITASLAAAGGLLEQATKLF